MLVPSQGCVLKLKNWFDENMEIFGGIGIFIGFTQVSNNLVCQMYILKFVLGIPSFLTLNVRQSSTCESLLCTHPAAPKDFPYETHSCSLEWQE